MNYKRIYDEFIADRLKKQPKDGEYYELHHIKPRCMRGDDGPNNLIRLSASDHLFAHQVLARAYNDTEYANNLWGAVLILCRDSLAMERTGQGGKRLGSLSIAGAKGLRMRKSIDLARKMRIDRNSGLSHPTTDKTDYVFRNDDGREFVGKRIEFEEKFNVTKPVIFRLIDDESNRSKGGWRVIDQSIDDCDRIKRRDLTRYKFINRIQGYSGRVDEKGNLVVGSRYVGTRVAFQRFTKLPWSIVHAIVDHYGASPCGWMRPLPARL